MAFITGAGMYHIQKAARMEKLTLVLVATTSGEMAALCAQLEIVGDDVG